MADDYEEDVDAAEESEGKQPVKPAQPGEGPLEMPEAGQYKSAAAYQSGQPQGKPADTGLPPVQNEPKGYQGFEEPAFAGQQKQQQQQQQQQGGYQNTPEYLQAQGQVQSDMASGRINPIVARNRMSAINSMFAGQANGAS